MNIAQILRHALYDVDAININGTTHRFVTQAELLAWAQDGHALLFAKLRQANQDFGFVTRQSTDGSFRWNGITYAPSSFALTTAARTYTLPPDVIEIRQIRALTSGQEQRLFEHKDLTDPIVVTQIRSESGSLAYGTIYWDLVGERTLRLARPPDVAMDIEISYIARPARLFLYTTGTISTTQNQASVTGSGTNWIINELSTPCELIISADTTAPWIVGQISNSREVDPSALYAPVSTIDSDTALTLLGSYLSSGVSARAYMLASVPSVPPDWQWVLTRWISAMCRWKANGAPPADRPEFEAILSKDMMPSVTQRQTADLEFTEDYDP